MATAWRRPRRFHRRVEPTLRHGRPGRHFYVGNTDGVVVFPYTEGASRITAPGRKLVGFKPGGHWTRSLLPSPDGQKLYAGVGSSSNIGEEGLEAEKGVPPFMSSTSQRAAAAFLPAACATRWASPGSRQTGALWTVVNERDGLGDETPPDYLTSVRDGGFYGWPYCYWGQTVDDRVPQDRGGGRKRASRRTTHWVGIPRRWACAGCRPARCRAFPMAWRSGSTGHGIAAS